MLEAEPLSRSASAPRAGKIGSWVLPLGLLRIGKTRGIWSCHLMLRLLSRLCQQKFSETCNASVTGGTRTVAPSACAERPLHPLCHSPPQLRHCRSLQGRDREGEAPTEPRGARACWDDSSPGGSPSQLFHTFLRHYNPGKPGQCIGAFGDRFKQPRSPI